MYLDDFSSVEGFFQDLGHLLQLQQHNDIFESMVQYVQNDDADRAAVPP